MRHPATQGRADANHRAVADAIRLLGYPVKDLSRNGDGVEDLLVGLHGRSREPWWIVCEIKVPKPERSKVNPLQFTRAQIEWRRRTEAWPRITVTSAQDAVNQIRAMTD